VFGHGDIALTLIALVVLALIFEPAGYVISATLFMFVLLRAFAGLGWMRASVSALTIALVTYYMFVKVLGVSLPGGLLPLP
jgi:putative tricarboxylic transport membrane protein